MPKRKLSYDITTGDGQKRMMYESVGLYREGMFGTININKPGDYGCDILPGGMFRMVPSGDIVDWEERNRRLGE